jgi:cytochrome c oxidase subunit 3
MDHLLAAAGAQLHLDAGRHDGSLSPHGGSGGKAAEKEIISAMPAPDALSDLPQFRDAPQRARANRLGLWAFLATEILLFGGLFLAYVLYRHAYPGAFAAGSGRLEFWIGTLNTAVLLTSSLCMALGDEAIKASRTGALRTCLILTWLLGAAFLGLKGYEYDQKYAEHLIPGRGFLPTPALPPQAQLFFFLYFAMTGLHALHMVAGLTAIAWLLRLNARGRLSPAQHAPVEMVGLYWHFIDCVWVFLYPLLYLIPHR